MKFDRAEIEVLALCAWCKDLPIRRCKNIPAEILDFLLDYGCIRPSKNNSGYRCTPRGFDILRRAEMEYEQDKTYRTNADALARRFQTAEITSFFWRYGADVFRDSPPAEKESDVFLPSFALRRQKHANILGGTILAGFYYSKDYTFIPYYIAAGNKGIYPDVEQRTFRSETLLCGKRPHIIYTGRGGLQRIIATATKRKEKSPKATTTHYLDAIEKFGCPVSFIPLTSDGMRQLRILEIHDHKQRLVKNILGNDYLPPTTTQSDGRNKTENFIIGIDCNILRFENAIKSKTKTNIFVLPFQADTVQAIVEGTNSKCYVLNLEETEEFLGLPHALPEISDKPFQTGKGNYINVPYLGKGKKTGR